MLALVNWSSCIEVKWVSSGQTNCQECHPFLKQNRGKRFATIVAQNACAVQKLASQNGSGVQVLHTDSFPKSIELKIDFKGGERGSCIYMSYVWNSQNCRLLYRSCLSFRSGSLAGRIGWMHWKIMPNIDNGSKNLRQNSWELPTSNLDRHVIADS